MRPGMLMLCFAMLATIQYNALVHTHATQKFMPLLVLYSII